MDDIIVIGSDPILLHKFIDRTHREFTIKDLGSLSYFLGLEVAYTSDGPLVGQAKYAHVILQRADLLDSKLIATLLVAGESLLSWGRPFDDLTLYRSLIGAIQYLTITRPDLSYVVNQVS